MIFLHPPQSCRYNVSGFVEELHHLPENRWGHACAALRGVRPVQSFPVTRVSLLPPASFCVYDSGSTNGITHTLTYRRLLLPEEGMTKETTFLLCSNSSLLMPLPGLPSPPSLVGCRALRLWLWETCSGWLGVKMVKVLPDMRWWF